MDDYRKTLAESLWKIIDKKGVSIKVAAELWGISPNELAGILKQDKDIRLSTLARISEGTDRPIASLICKEEVQKNHDEELLRGMYECLGRRFRKGGVAR